MGQIPPNYSQLTPYLTDEGEKAIKGKRGLRNHRWTMFQLWGKRLHATPLPFSVHSGDASVSYVITVTS